MTQDEVKATDKAQTTKVAEYTLEEIKQHNKDSDCWVIIHGKVYDVSKYLDDHPGGPEIIVDVGGTDATGDFEDTGHTKDAREKLNSLYIGNVIGGAATGATKDGSSQSSSNFVLFLTISFAIAAAILAFYQDEILIILQQNGFFD